MTTLVEKMRRTIVGSRELKTRLGAYLREVQKGRVIIVTDRGRPVAELRRIARPGIGEQARLEELVALGLLSKKSTARPMRRKPLQVAGESLSTAVLDGREDRL